jgi:DNA end-binding protein Ku
LPEKRRRHPHDNDDHETDDGRIRPFWSGTISFGLVSVPVNLLPAVRSRHVAMRMLDRDGTPLQRRYYCPADDRELDGEDIVRGFEMDGEFVVVTDEELEELEPEKTRDIDLRRFVDRNAIDPRFFERAHFLAPAGGSTKAYRLLAQTMEDSGRAGIATFVMRGTEYLVAILADHGVLRIETLRFQDEIRTPEDIGLPDPPRVKKTDVTKMEKAIRSLSEDTLDPRELDDPYTDALLQLVAEKQAEGMDIVEAPEAEAEAEDGAVIDLMTILKRSMKGGRAEESAKAKSRASRRTAAPTGTTRKTAPRKASKRKRAA